MKYLIILAMFATGCILNDNSVGGGNTTDTLYVQDTLNIHHLDTVVAIEKESFTITKTDTVSLVEWDTLRISNTDTLKTHQTDTLKTHQTDTLKVADTISVTQVITFRDTVTVVETNTLYDTVTLVKTDTVVKVRVDTVSIVIRDTLREIPDPVGLKNDTVLLGGGVVDVFVYSENGATIRKRYDLKSHPHYSFMHQEAEFKGQILHGVTKEFKIFTTCGKNLLKTTKYDMGSKEGMETQYSCNTATGQTYKYREITYSNNKFVILHEFNTVGVMIREVK